MKQLCLLLFLFTISFEVIKAQQTFQRIIKANADMGLRSITPTADSGYAMAGYVYEYMLLVKMNKDFEPEWTKTYGGYSPDWAYDAKQTMDGGYIIVGQSSSFDLGGSTIYMVKTDSTGAMEWAKTYQNPGGNVAYCIQQTTDSGYVMAGKGPGCINGGMYLIKTDVDGDTLWTRIFDGGGMVVVDDKYFVSETYDGGYIAVGTKWGGAMLEEIFVVRTDINGDTLWTRIFGGTGRDGGYCITPTKDSCFVLTGYTESFGPWGYNIFLMKINDNGDTLWTKTYGSTGTYHGYFVKETQDGGFIITGGTNVSGWLNGLDDIVLIRTNSVGDTLWTKVYGRNGQDECWTAVETQDKGYILTDFYYFNNDDGYLVKTDSTGNTGCNQYQFNTSIEVGNASFSIGSGSVMCSGLIVGSPNSTEGNLTLYLDDACDTITYINEEITEANGVLVYPNPFSESATVELNGIELPADFALYDVMGSKVRAFPVSSFEFLVEREGLSDGVYFYHISDNTGQLLTGKLVIH